MSLTVEPAGAASYEVDTEQVLHETMAPALTPGARVTVKVDPNDAHCLMVWSTGTPTAPTTATEGPISRLAKLQKLRDMGALTDEEFEAKKAKLLLAE